MKVGTNGYGGKYVREKIRVQTNDINRPWIGLAIRGQVKNFARIEPARVNLVGKIGDDLRAVVKIQPRPDHPFKIIGVRNAQGDKFIRYHLTDTPGAKDYRLEVENRSSQKGTYFDQIMLQTDNPLRPELRVSISGRLS